MDTPHLQQTLRKTHGLKRAVDFFTAAGRGVAWLILAVLIAVLLDATLAFNSIGLIAVDLLIAGLILYGVWRLARAWRRGRFNPRRTSRWIEERLGLHDSRYINAVDLAHAGGALSDLAVKQGESTADQVRPSRIVDKHNLKRAALHAAGVAGIVVLGLLLVPSLFGMVIPRYLSPTADLPPFTLLRFEVATEPDRIYHGKSAGVRVTITGPTLPETAEVVFTDDPSRPRSPMLRQEAGIFLLPIERSEKSRRFYIHTPHGRSYEHELTVLPVPLFEAVNVRYEYPTYTGWPTIERPLTEAGLRAITGTSAQVTIESNIALEKGVLTFRGESDSSPAQTITLTASQSNPAAVTGSLELTAGGTFALDLVAADGTPSEEPVTGQVVVLADRPPGVQLLSPDLRVVAPEGWKVPVQVSAVDDVGVRSASLHIRRNDDAAQPDELELTRPRPTYATSTTHVDLAALGAKAGDTVKGFAVAFDNRPDPPQSADSPTFEIQVLTEEQYKELARQQYAMEELLAELEAFQAEQAKLDEKRDKLIEQLEALEKKAEENGGQLSDEDRATAEKLRKELEEYAEQTQELADKIQERADRLPLYDFEPAVQRQLKETAERLSQHASDSAQSAKGLAAPSAGAIKDALEQLKKDREASDKESEQQELTEEQLRKLELADRIMAEADALLDITRRQRDVAERLSTYQDAQSLSREQESRLQQLALEQQQLETELRESLERLEKAANDATEDLPRMSGSALEIAQQIRHDLDVPKDQLQAVSSAQASQGSQAHASADSAAEKLESLVSQCKGLCPCAGGDLDGLFGLTESQIQNALNQLSAGRAGRGSGAGSGSATGRGTGAGPYGTRAGGSPSRPTLLGPHTRTASDRVSHQAKLRTGTANALTPGFGEAQGDEPQLWELDPDDPRYNAVGAPPGVPLQYRRLAEQYFRRLAEDSK